MAGHSEVCSHVGAVLYALEYSAKQREETSCTDVKAVWPVPSTSKPAIVPIAEVNWGRVSKTGKTEPPPLNIGEVLQKLKDADCNSALMRVIEPFASQLENETVDIPSIFDIYSIANETLHYQQLLKISEQTPFVISREVCAAIEQNTRFQSKCSLWYKQRAGRITASNFKSCCRTHIEKPSLSLIKSICYPSGRYMFLHKSYTMGNKT